MRSHYFHKILVTVVISAIVLLSLLLGVTRAADTSNAPSKPSAILDQNLSTEEREDLLARLSDEQVRSIVWQLIRTEKEQQTPTDSAVQELTAITDRFRAGLLSELKQIPNIARIPSVMATAMVPPGRDKGDIWLVLVYLGGILLVGWASQHLFKRLSARIPEALAMVGGNNFPQRLGRRLLLLVYDLFIPIVFVLGAYIAFLLVYGGHEPNRLLMMGILAGILFAWLLNQLVNFVFSPHRSSSRLTPLNNADSQLLSSRVSWIFIGGSFLYFFQNYLGAISSPFEGPALVKSVSLVGGIILIATIITVMWLIRRPVSTMLMAGRPPGSIRKLFTAIWPIIGTAIVLLLFVFALFSAIGLEEKGVLTSVLKTLLLLLMILPLILGATAPFIREWGVSEPELENLKTNRHGTRGGIVQAARAVVILLALMALGQIWHIDFVELTASSLGEKVAGMGAKILVTLAIAYTLWAATKRWLSAGEVDQTADEAEESDAHAGSDPGGQGLSRAATVLPLLRGFLFVTIFVVAVMAMLASLGINIGPLIAAASVIGLAVGFGAQTLVADIISGVFFLIDDAFRKGEYIDVGGNTGTVEQISVRSMQLRHHNGPVHTIPYSTISTLTNFSRDWVIMKFELRVHFEQDVEKVRKLIKKVGKELMDDPEHGPQFLDGLKSQGVNRMDDSAFVIRCKFSAKPGNQWALRRVAYAKIQEAFADAGIQFAPKRVVVEAVTSKLAVAGAAVAVEASDSEDNANEQDRG
ncbi:MAG: mechanosensitive ion channel domain-containing protein [Arenicellales bacterium]